MATSNRFRAGALIASTVLVFIFTALHPRFADPTDNAAVFHTIASAGVAWRVAQTARILAWLLILVGLLPTGPSRRGVAGYVLLVVGTVFQLAHSGFEVVLHLVLAPWLAASSAEAAEWLRIATLLRNADAGTIAVSLIASGAGLTALGLDQLAPKRVLGCVLAALATIVGTSGVAFALTLDFRAMAPAFLASLLLHLWLAVIGVVLLRTGQPNNSPQG